MADASASPSKKCMALSTSQRLGVFVDVQNVFYSAKNFYQSKVDYGLFLKQITGSRRLIRAIAYVIQKADINQTGFHEALRRAGYELKIKESRETQDNKLPKVSWEVGIAVDVLEARKELDTVTLVTGGGDYIPLVHCLKSHGCRVEVVGVEGCMSGDLLRAADEFIPLSQEWMFKEKKFEHAAPKRYMNIYEGLPSDADLDTEMEEHRRRQAGAV